MKKKLMKRLRKHFEIHVAPQVWLEYGNDNQSEMNRAWETFLFINGIEERKH